jgi:hypothetical protein
MDLDKTEKIFSIISSTVTICTPIVAGAAWFVSWRRINSQQITQKSSPVESSQPPQIERTAEELKGTGIQAALLVINISFVLLMVLSLLSGEDYFEAQMKHVPLAAIVGLIVVAYWVWTPLFLLTEVAVWFSRGWSYSSRYTAGSLCNGPAKNQAAIAP